MIMTHTTCPRDFPGRTEAWSKDTYVRMNASYMAERCECGGIRDEHSWGLGARGTGGCRGHHGYACRERCRAFREPEQRTTLPEGWKPEVDHPKHNGSVERLMSTCVPCAVAKIRWMGNQPRGSFAHTSYLRMAITYAELLR